MVEGAPRELKQGIGADTVVLQLAATNGDLESQRARSGGCWKAWSRPMRSPLTRGREPCGAERQRGDPGPAAAAGWRRVQIAGLQMSQPSLDNVFMKYTGRHIREEAADQPIIMGW